MKKYIIIFVIAFAGSFYLLSGCGQDVSDLVTKEEFQIAHEVLNKKIDSLAEQLDNVELIVQRTEKSIDSIKLEIKDLKDGQEVIYYEVATTNLSFWQKIYQLRTQRGF